MTNNVWFYQAWNSWMTYYTGGAVWMIKLQLFLWASEVLYFQDICVEIGGQNASVSRMCQVYSSFAVKMEVLCLEDSIHVVLEESGQIQLNKDNLRLSDPNCTLHSNGTHILANMSLIGCGTQMEVSEKYILTYSQTFTNLHSHTLTNFYKLQYSHIH